MARAEKRRNLDDQLEQARKEGFDEGWEAAVKHIKNSVSGVFYVALATVKEEIEDAIEKVGRGEV